MKSYTADYRRNLIQYWQQFYPEWQIPKGYHVHHIKPKCTFKDNNDLRLHHPSNLIALHPDDHVAIHRNRGDHFVENNFMLGVIGARPWNKGLSKENDRRVAAYASTKVGKRRPDMVGKRPWNKGLTKDSDNASMQQQSKSLKGRAAPNKGQPSPNKGRTYEEIYGKEKAAELIEKRRLAKIKYWNEKP